MNKIILTSLAAAAICATSAQAEEVKIEAIVCKLIQGDVKSVNPNCFVDYITGKVVKWSSKPEYEGFEIVGRLKHNTFKKDNETYERVLITWPFKELNPSTKDVLKSRLQMPNMTWAIFEGDDLSTTTKTD